ncbi:MAG: hypothetical protein QOC56_755 [Alphaproteobacteria bacterium]|jgi:hypothetical protein|nr:hypothetical protein [Alphaproteobacteria bacterium]
MFDFNRLLNWNAAQPSSFDFGRMLNWKILRGSHEFPGPDGGTCVNEAAIVAAGYAYRPVRRIEDCPQSFSRPLALYAMCINEIVLDDRLRAELLMPFVTRLAGSADTREVERERVALVIRRTMTDILADALDFCGYRREARRCRGVTTLDAAMAIVNQLPSRDWHTRADRSPVNAIAMAIQDYQGHRSVEAAQFAGTVIADLAEIVMLLPGRPDGRRAAEALYRQGAAILDAALKIGRQAPPIAEDVAATRMETAKRAARAHAGAEPARAA